MDHFTVIYDVSRPGRMAHSQLRVVVMWADNAKQAAEEVEKMCLLNEQSCTVTHVIRGVSEL